MERGTNRRRRGGGTPKETMTQLDEEGRVWYPDGQGQRPQLKRYLDEMHGVPMGSVWTDIPPINSQAAERLGYPTQKPLALLNRIIKASSNTDDIVLDAFCGCGTALVAAEQLDRRWIGIDISPTACRVMAGPAAEGTARLREGEATSVVRDLPRTEEQLREMPPFRVRELGGDRPRRHPEQGESGRHGHRRPHLPRPAITENGPQERRTKLHFMDVWYPIQVKQKDKAGRPDIDAFEAVMTREDRTKGLLRLVRFHVRRPGGNRRVLQEVGEGHHPADRAGNPR